MNHQEHIILELRQLCRARPKVPAPVRGDAGQGAAALPIAAGPRRRGASNCARKWKFDTNLRQKTSAGTMLECTVRHFCC
ncbi:hypothetical protein [Massilia glaciei]|uniref:hypothetical protein n=1 Tax=Massilia glaciei TaxID=1524097 RepID=UPI0011B1EB07|nr:hypothetical protein [Massilia glaciei]